MTVTVDTSPIFPECPTFGFTAEPNYLVKITAREGGFERRQRVWARPLTKFTAVPMGDRKQQDIEQLLHFWHAVGGMSTPFRFKDWLDFKSCMLDETPSATDQPIILDTNGHARLAKLYTFGNLVQQREIQRPDGVTIEIANGAGDIQDPSLWTLDESTGIVTPLGGFVGVPSSWGGEFYCWCRFDGQLNPSISNHKIQNVTIQLTELRQPLT